MIQRDKPRTIRAVRKRADVRPVQAGTALPPHPELSNYELIERRSRELELERAKGGAGTSQPPDAETPLLVSSRPQPQISTARSKPTGRNAPGQTPAR